MSIYIILLLQDKSSSTSMVFYFMLLYSNQFQLRSNIVISQNLLLYLLVFGSLIHFAAKIFDRDDVLCDKVTKFLLQYIP